jgi:carotenoid isomerooxygenase
LIQQNAQSDPNYASLFRGRPKRFVMPLNPKQGKEGNLNTYAHSLSEAKWMNGGSSMYIKPDELCPLGCETPQINYNKYNGIYWNQITVNFFKNDLFNCAGKPYRYFYAISSDVDAENPGTVRIIV